MTTSDFKSDLIHLCLLILILAIENWLGKTKRVRSGSILELFFDLIKILINRKKGFTMSEETQAAPQVESKGIKEMLELFEGLKELAKTAKIVMKDKHLDLNDVPAVMQLIEKQTVILAAFMGLSEVKAEAKDLSLEEMAALVASLMQAAKEVKEA